MGDILFPTMHLSREQGAYEEEDEDAGGKGHISGRCAANSHVEMINATN